MKPHSSLTPLITCIPGKPLTKVHSERKQGVMVVNSSGDPSVPMLYRRGQQHWAREFFNLKLQSGLIYELTPSLIFTLETQLMTSEDQVAYLYTSAISLQTDEKSQECSVILEGGNWRLCALLMHAHFYTQTHGKLDSQNLFPSFLSDVFEN